MHLNEFSINIDMIMDIVSIPYIFYDAFVALKFCGMEINE